MNGKEINSPVTLCMLKSLLAAYFVTGIMLVLLAFLLYRFDWNESKVAIGIIAIYVLSTFTGGVLMGKYMRHKKYIWGMILGILYVALLFLITLIVYRTLNHNDIVTTIILCVAGGMLGGMLS
ncbi:MAG: TIGR04086 family membrane protein [Eubacteriales bacterium]